MATIEYTRDYDGTRSREFVQFSEDAIQNPAKSEAAGRPIYDAVEMISISFPGNNLTEVVRKVTDADRQKYQPQYEAFKKHGGTVLNGTPLEAWTALSKAQVREFQAMKIFTIEQLASMDDHGTQRMGMGGQMWRERARIFLEASEDNATVDKIAAENFRLKAQVETMGKQLAELGGICQGLQAQLQAMQNGRADVGLPVTQLPAAAVTVPVANPELAPGALGQPQMPYVEPKRRGRRAAQEAA